MATGQLEAAQGAEPASKTLQERPHRRVAWVIIIRWRSPAQCQTDGHDPTRNSSAGASRARYAGAKARGNAWDQVGLDVQIASNCQQDALCSMVSGGIKQLSGVEGRILVHLVSSMIML